MRVEIPLSTYNEMLKTLSNMFGIKIVEVSTINLAAEYIYEMAKWYGEKEKYDGGVHRVKKAENPILNTLCYVHSKVLDSKKPLRL